MFAEVLSPDGTWQPVSPVFQEDTGDPEFEIFFMDTVYNNRDYQLFAALSGVRDDWLPGETFLPEWYPLVKDRLDAEDLPEDVSPDVRKVWVSLSGGNLHSACVATLEELLSVDWSFLDSPDEWLATLKTLGELGSPDRVRAVWWFDS